MPCCYEHPSHSLSKDHLSGAVEPRRDTLPSVPPTSQSVALCGHRAGPWVHHQEMPFPISSRATIAPRPFSCPKTSLQGPRGEVSREVAVWMLQTKTPSRAAGRIYFRSRIRLVPVIAALLVAGNNAVFAVNHTVRVLGDIVLVRDQDDCVSLALQTVKQRHDFHASLRVQVSSRFVRQNDRGLVHQRARNR